MISGQAGEYAMQRLVFITLAFAPVGAVTASVSQTNVELSGRRVWARGHAHPGEAEVEQAPGLRGEIVLMLERSLFDQLPGHDCDRERDGGRGGHHCSERQGWKEKGQGLLDREGVDVDAVGVVAPVVEAANASAGH